jgi:hypothetical protein
MRLAESFARLGSETAFEVLARARQLESEGRIVILRGDEKDGFV